MRPHKFLLALLLIVQASAAWGGCALGALPFVLQNGTVADATQVDANFNQIVNAAASGCAAAGANNDITSLGALSTPLSPAQGGSPVFAGGTTTGSSNYSINVNSNFSLTVGYHVTGFWGSTNAGAGTIQVNGGTVQGIWRKIQFGISPTVGGELIAGHPFDLIWNGSVFINISEVIFVGEYKTIAYTGVGVNIPPGYLVADGSSFVCASFQDLCNVIGNTYGGTSSNPLLPDTRGRVLTGLDNYGTSPGAAGRLTNAATGCGSVFTFVGANCANSNQSHTQIVAELATHNHTASSSSSSTDSGHTHGLTQTANGGSVTSNSYIVEVSAGGTNTNPGSGTNARLDGTISVNTGTANISTSTSTTVNNNGSSQAMPIVNPNMGAIMVIRF